MGKDFNFKNRHFNNFRPDNAIAENKANENKVVENVEEKAIVKNDSLDETNYLNLGKKPQEKLVTNGLVFKHGSVANCNTLNFRKKPDKLSEVIHTFTAGEEILYTETDKPDWYEVKDKDGVLGYCMSDYIKIEI